MPARFEPGALRAMVAPYTGHARWLVAYSGGLDSTVLLHALAALAPRPPLEAVHVHHGLHPQADAWAAHCGRQARVLSVPLRVARVDARPAVGESPEAAARTARYAALRDRVAPGTVVFTAQHADDQAETVLLQLLRGAGPGGLSGMPAEAPFGAGLLVRPLLPWPRTALADYARDQGLVWVEDPGNQDPRVDRSYLRAVVIPALRERWPGLTQTLGRVAALQAEAAEILAQDADSLLAEVAGGRPGTLSARALRALPTGRAANLLQHWIRIRGLPVPGRARLLRILRDVTASRHDAQPCVRWPGAEARRHRDDVYVMAPLSALRARAWDWDQRGPLEIPELGVMLDRERLLAAGFPLPPPEVKLRACLRRGGERCAAGPGRARRALSRWFQEAGVPPWERDRMPLLFDGDRLLGVVGLGPCCGSAGRDP